MFSFRDEISVNDGEVQVRVTGMDYWGECSCICLGEE